MSHLGRSSSTTQLELKTTSKKPPHTKKPSTKSPSSSASASASPLNTAMKGSRSSLSISCHNNNGEAESGKKRAKKTKKSFGRSVYESEDTNEEEDDDNDNDHDHEGYKSNGANGGGGDGDYDHGQLIEVVIVKTGGTSSDADDHYLVKTPLRNGGKKRVGAGSLEGLSVARNDTSEYGSSSLLSSSPLSPVPSLLRKKDRVFSGRSVIQWRVGGITKFAIFAMLLLTFLTIMDAVIYDHPLAPERNLYGHFKGTAGKSESGPNDYNNNNNNNNNAKEVTQVRHLHENLGCPSPKFVIKEWALGSFVVSPFFVPLRIGLWEDEKSAVMQLQELQGKESQDNADFSLSSLVKVTRKRKPVVVKEDTIFTFESPPKPSPHSLPRGHLLQNICAILMAMLNITSLSLAESSLLVILGSQKKIAVLFVLSWVLLMVFRVALGFLFSRALGWAAPEFFVSDAMHECGKGLSPLVVVLLVFLSFNMNHCVSRTLKQYTIYLPVWLMVMIICGLNVILGATFWWNLSGLLTGLILSPILLCLTDSQYPVAPAFLGRGSPISLGRIPRFLFSTLFMILISSMFLLLPRLLPQTRIPNAADLLPILGGKDKLVVFLVFSAPRPNAANHLLPTLQSYVNALPKDPEDPLFHLFRIVAFTTFGFHPAFEHTRKTLTEDSAAMSSQPYIDWIQQNDLSQPSMYKQRLDFAAGLIATTIHLDTKYIALIEDDFPLCENGWSELLRLIYQANVEVPQHCGLFIGTGGSGLILKTELVSKLVDILINEPKREGLDIVPADLLVQECLRGVHPQCQECAGSMVTSRTLLMNHIGHQTSTGYRIYSTEMWQCGWRHPFDGEADVITL